MPRGGRGGPPRGPAALPLSPRRRVSDGRADPQGRRLAQLAEIPVSLLDKVKPKKAKALADWGVTSVLDLLTTYPRRYIDRTRAADVGRSRRRGRGGHLRRGETGPQRQEPAGPQSGRGGRRRRDRRPHARVLQPALAGGAADRGVPTARVREAHRLTAAGARWPIPWSTSWRGWKAGRLRAGCSRSSRSIRPRPRRARELGDRHVRRRRRSAAPGPLADPVPIAMAAPAPVDGRARPPSGPSTNPRRPRSPGPPATGSSSTSSCASSSLLVLRRRALERAANAIRHEVSRRRAVRWRLHPRPAVRLVVCPSI